jgi:hypothetical protein
MPITQQQLDALEADVNARLASHKASFVMSVHFGVDRVNDARNVPPITIAELESIFDRLINQHLMAILVLNDGDTFTIRCGTSHINMPCGVKKTTSPNASISQKNIVITVMRKQGFFSKDPVVFAV